MLRYDDNILLANLGTRASGPHAGGTPAHPATPTRAFASSILQQPW